VCLLCSGVLPWASPADHGQKRDTELRRPDPVCLLLFSKIFLDSIRKKFFTGRVSGRWTRLPREADTAPSLSEFKECLGDALSHMI